MSTLPQIPFWLLSAILLLSGLYCWFIGNFWIDFPDTHETETLIESDNQHSFAVVVPFKNEEPQLPQLIQALARQTHKGSLIVFVDDHSTDNSWNRLHDLIQSYQLNAQVIKNQGTGKKQAIHTAANYLSSDYIILTDADCTPSPNWISQYGRRISAGDHWLLIAPVITSTEKSFVGKFQELDFLSFIAATFGSRKDPFLCNAANLCFKRETFLELRPYQDNFHVPTGDDIFLLEAFKRKDPKSILVCTDKELWLETRVKSNWMEFLEQRIRWGSKAINYKNLKSLLIAGVVLAINVSLWILIIYSFLNPRICSLALVVFGLKLIVDSLLLIKATNFFGKQYLIPLILVAEIIQIAYVPIAAIAGLFRNLLYYKK